MEMVDVLEVVDRPGVSPEEVLAEAVEFAADSLDVQMVRSPGGLAWVVAGMGFVPQFPIRNDELLPVLRRARQIVWRTSIEGEVYSTDRREEASE